MTTSLLRFVPSLILTALVATTVGIGGCAADATDDPNAAASPTDDPNAVVPPTPTDTPNAGATSDDATPDDDAADDVIAADEDIDDVAEYFGQDTVDDAVFSHEDADEEVEEIWGHVTKIQSVGPPDSGSTGRYRSEIEWHKNGEFKVRGEIEWLEKQNEELRQSSVQFQRITEMMGAATKALGEILKQLSAKQALIGRLMIRTARSPHGTPFANKKVATWWNSGWKPAKKCKKTCTWVATRGGNDWNSFPSFWFAKKERPYVRFEAGRKGKKKIVFAVYPLEAG